MMNKIVKKFPGQIEGYVEGRHIKLQWALPLVKFPKKKALMRRWSKTLQRLINEKVKSLPQSS